MNVSNNPPGGGLPFNEHLEESPVSPSTPGEVGQAESSETIHGSASTGTSHYWSLKWPDLRACTSTIRSITSACIGSLLRTIKWAFYSCAVSSSKRNQANDSEEFAQAINEPDQVSSSEEPAQPTSELNQVDYSQQPIQVNDRHDGCSFPIPCSGLFQAGKDLRSQFAAYLFEKVVALATKVKSGEAEGITQTRLDMGRCTAFTIIDERGQEESIGYSAYEEGTVDQETIGNNGIAKITQIVGGEGHLATAILSLTNQTAGNACYRLYSNSNENLRTDGAKGFPTSFPQLKYTLTKQREAGSECYHFKFEGGGLIDTFSLKKTAQEIKKEQASLKKEIIKSPKYKKADSAEKKQLIQDVPKRVSNIRELTVDEKLKMIAKTSLSIKITPNAHFDETREMNSDNFPCTLEVVELTNTYETALSRGEVASPSSGPAVLPTNTTSLASF